MGFLCCVLTCAKFGDPAEVNNYRHQANGPQSPCLFASGMPQLGTMNDTETAGISTAALAPGRRPCRACPFGGPKVVLYFLDARIYGRNDSANPIQGRTSLYKQIPHIRARGGPTFQKFLQVFEPSKNGVSAFGLTYTLFMPSKSPPMAVKLHQCMRPSKENT